MDDESTAEGTEARDSGSMATERLVDALAEHIARSVDTYVEAQGGDPFTAEDFLDDAALIQALREMIGVRSWIVEMLSGDPTTHLRVNGVIVRVQDTEMGGLPNVTVLTEDEWNEWEAYLLAPKSTIRGRSTLFLSTT